MIVRDLPEHQAIVLSQEAHADLAAQFAAHWGNERFSRLRPYNTMLFATVYHDSHHRELEARLPVVAEKGRPAAFREGGEKPGANEALLRHLAWLEGQDPYAGLIVSMHHSGLPQNRYDTVSMGSKGGSGSAARVLSPERRAFLDRLEASQRSARENLERAADEGERLEAELRFNYRVLQVFDLLSLYFCCDGYADQQLAADSLKGVPVRYDSTEEVEISLTPQGENVVRLNPYPFDASPLVVAVEGRVMQPQPGSSEEDVRRSYYGARRTSLSWQLVA